ncbi:MAG: C25 family cysteine peptidase [Candidatus Eisenbacteria bacterium]
MRLSGLRISLLVVVALCTLGVAASASAEALTTTIRVSPQDLSLERSGEFDVVRLEGRLTTHAEGYPELPLELVRFALPDGMVAVRADARVLSQRELPGSYLVRPRQPEVPLSMPELARWTDPNRTAYASQLPYPEQSCVLLGSGNAGGQGIATVAFHPVQYVAGRGQLTLNERTEITLTLEPARRTVRMPGIQSPGSARAAADRSRSLVVNPEDVIDRTAGPRAGRGEVDYLVITSSSYEPIFQDLTDWKEQKGLTAEVVTTTWVYANYGGVDQQDQIRNCIIDYYENKGTVWVLLGGDTGVVPERTVYAMTSGVGGAVDENKIRCDLYYGDLDGTWDGNANGTYGQITLDDIDMYADVFVGRAPVDDTTEAERFVNKVLTYEGAPAGDPLPTDYQRDILFMAEVLWTDPWTDHAICKNMIDDESVPSRFDPITKLYQTSGNLSTSSAVAAMDEGYNIVNHNGHANTTVLSIGGSALYRSHFDGLTNAPRYGLFYSMGCWSAAIDKDCIAEHWNNSPSGGGIAYIGNSRYGWGSPGNPGTGTGDVFDREFFKKLFNEGLERAGVAHAAHKDVFVEQARTNGYVRYTLYELNLLGDPETTIWTEDPVIASVTHADEAPLGEHELLVTVAREGAALAGATVHLSNDEVSVVATTGPDGVAVLSPAPTVEGTMAIVVTGRGVLPYEGGMAVVDQPPDTDAPIAIDNMTPADPFDLGGVVLLNWEGYSPPADFAHYRVYRDTERFWDVAGMTPIATVLDAGSTDWADVTAENRRDYYYAVTAVDLSGNERTDVSSEGPVSATVNSMILLWDADDGDKPFDGIGDDYTAADGSDVPWREALDSIGELYSVSETLPADLSPFELIIYLGGVASFGEPEANVTMTDDDAAALTSFIEEGGDVYVEEPMFGFAYYINGSPTTIELWDLFHATYSTGLGKADGNVVSVTGQSGRLTQGMSLDYDYQGWPDQFVGEVGPNGDADAALVWLDQGALERGALCVDTSTGSRRYMVPVLLGGMTDGSYPSIRLEYVTRILDDSGLIGTAGVDDAEVGRLNRLLQNSPNPFNPSTSIRYSVARDGARVGMHIYDVAGRRVATVLDKTAQAGHHVASWDGRDDGGSPVASGIYFCRLSVDAWSATRKMVLLK